MPLTVSNDLKTQKNKLEQKDPWIYLCELEIEEGNWRRFAYHVQDVWWNDVKWTAFPIAVSDLKYSSDGEVAVVTVGISNAGGVLTEYLLQYNGLIGKTGNLYYVHLAFLDDPLYSVIPDNFKIIASGGQDIVIFNLALSIDAYNIEGPMESFDHEKFPGMPMVSPRVSIGII